MFLNKICSFKNCFLAFVQHTLVLLNLETKLLNNQSDTCNGIRSRQQKNFILLWKVKIGDTDWNKKVELFPLNDFLHTSRFK